MRQQHKPTTPVPDPSSRTFLFPKVPLFIFSKYFARTMAASQTTHPTSPIAAWWIFKEALNTSISLTNVFVKSAILELLYSEETSCNSIKKVQTRKWHIVVLSDIKITIRWDSTLLHSGFYLTNRKINIFRVSICVIKRWVDVWEKEELKWDFIFEIYD